MAATLFAWACGDGSTDPPETNNAPVASGAIPAQTVHVGETVTVSLSQYFNDPDGDVLTYTAQTANANVATVSISGSSALVTGVSQGNTTATVTASDPGGLTAQQSFVVDVPNRAPEAVGTIPDQELFAGDTVRIDVSRYFSDPDGDALTHTAESANGDVATISISGSSAVVTGVSRGNTTVTVTASDPNGLAAQQSFVVDVPNGAPEAVGAIPDQELFAGNTVRIDVSRYFSDPDGDALTHTAESANGDVATISISGSSAVVTGVSRGNTTVTVTASDPDGLTAQQVFTVNVPNRAPEAVGTIPDQELFAGDTIRIDVSRYFNDPDGDALTYAAESEDGGVATISISGSSAVVTGVSRGNTTATVTASDPGGLTAQQSFVVDVPNGAPEAVGAIPDQELFAGDTVRIDVSRYFNDPDGDALAHDVATANESVAIATLAGSTITLVAVADGEALITVTASDPGGLSARQRFRTVVKPLPLPKVEFTTGSAAAPEGGTVVLDVAVDPAPDSTLEVGYKIGSDDDPDTDDADGADHNGGSGGTLRFNAGATRATIEIAVLDDNDIEPTREVLTVSLNPPDGAGYTLGESATAVLTIEEGVCDRTPQVRDALVALARVDHCRKADDSHLVAIDTLDLRGPEPLGRYVRQDAWADPWSCRPQPKSISQRADSEPRKAMLRECASGLLQPRLSPPPSPNQGGARPGEPIVALRAGDFSGLTELVELWLFRNRLTELPAGVFAGLDELQRLLLGFNRLTGLREGVFSGLPQLTDLSVQENELSRLPPNVFAGLSRLQELWIYGNDMTELPAGISELVRLEKLIAWGNRLLVLPAGVLSGLSNLEVLSLADNRLTQLDRKAFASLTSLLQLDLRTNRLTELPPGLLSNLGTLEFLSLSENRLERLPDGVFDGLDALEHLYLSANILTDLQSGLFSDLGGLRELWMSDNRISRLTSGTFSGLSGLRLLNLRKNRIADLEPGILAGLGSLEVLALDENPLPELKSDVFADLARLQELWVSSGDLSYLHPGAFNGLTRLSKLYLHENRLDRLVDGTFQGLSGVEEVWLYENEIEEISTVAFTGMPLLELLVLWGNRFDALPRGVFSPLTKLKEVWMGDSQLTTLPSGAFENLGELTLLHLYQNLLSELPDSLFTGLSELANLNLDKNPGTPFTLTVHLERTDTSDLDAPGPATLVAALAEGAPFSMRIPLSVDGGTISTDTVVIEGGQITSAEFTVTQDSSSEITRVIVGPAPAVPAPYRGIDVVADDTLTLFSSSGDGESDMASRVYGWAPGSDVSASALAPKWTAGSETWAVKPRWTGINATPGTGCTGAFVHCRPGAHARSAGVRAWSRRGVGIAPSDPALSSRGWFLR